VISGLCKGWDGVDIREPPSRGDLSLFWVQLLGFR
jgi:hypothetical protein